MLSLFRRGGTGQVVLGAIVVVIMVVFILEFRQGAGTPTGRLALECAVEVKGRCVEEKDFFAAYMLVVPRGMPAKAVKQLGLRRMVMDGLVERELLVAEAERIGIGIGEDAVNDELVLGRAHFSLPIARFPSIAPQIGLVTQEMMMAGLRPEMVTPLRVDSLKTKSFDMKQYEREIRLRTNRGPKEFKEMQTAELVAERMRELVRSQVRIAEQEAWLLFERERSKAVARVVRVERAWFGRYVVALDDAAVERFQKENSSKLDAEWETAKASWKAGCPLVDEIMLAIKPTTTDDDKLLLRGRLEEIRERIAKGESFASIARLESEGKTALAGGELGCLADDYGDGARELIEAVSKLEPGKLSLVIETKRGLHVLRSQGKLEDKDVEGRGKKTLARRLAMEAATDQAAKSFAQKLIEAAQAGETLDAATQRSTREALPRPKPQAGKPAPKSGEEPPALRDVAKPKLEITAPFTITSRPIADAAPGQSPAAAAFALENPDALHPDPIPVRGGYTVLQLKEKTLASREQLARERDTFVPALRAQKEQEAVQMYLARLRETAKAQIKINERLAADPAGAERETE